jgi:transposase-like protein
MSMPKIARLTGGGDAIQLGFVECIHTPIGLMEYAIELHLNGLSLSDTALALERFGIGRAKSTIHNWVQKSDLEPREGLSPDNVTLDETVIKVKGERFWLDGAVNPETNQILHQTLSDEKYGSNKDVFERTQRET